MRMMRKVENNMSNTKLHWENLPASSLQRGSQRAADWDRLCTAGGNLPFLSSDAVISALEILGDRRERLLAATDGSRVRAMFILAPAGQFRWATFQPSQLPLGAWVADSDLLLGKLARSLLKGPLGFCLVLSVTQVDPMVAPRPADAPDSHTGDYIETGWVDIQGSFEDYWASRGKNLRQNMRKQRSKMQAEGIVASMEVLRGQEDMATAIDRYGQLESAGWKAQEGTALHLDNAQGKFYTELLQQSSQRGEAVVYQYRFDDRVVAMNLCLQRNGVLVVLKTTYDESIQYYSPAFLLRESEMQAFHAEGLIRRVEYYGRLMDWHTKLTSEKRTLYHLTLYRWPLVRRLAESRRMKAVAQAQES